MTLRSDDVPPGPQIPPPDVADGLRPLIVRGIAWKAIGQVGIQLTRLAVAVVLARILAPQQYGLAGMALVFNGFILIFADLALGQAVVQRRSLTEADKATTFWTSILAGAAFAAVGVALSGSVAAFFGEPELRPMIALLSLGFLISSVGTTQSALLVREMAFRGLEIREIVATAGGAGAAIAVALAGGGAWAIIAQQLTVSTLSTVLVWFYSSWRPSLRFSVSSLRSFVGFTANVLGTNVLTQLRSITDNALIGRYLGASSLGVYALAYNVILVPFNRLAVPVAQVLFPALSRLQEDVSQVGVYWRRSIRLVGAFAMPALVGLILVAPEFVDVVLGDKWHEAVPVIRLLGVVGLLQTLQFLNPIVLQALDRTSMLLRWTLFSYGAAVTAFVVGLHWGIVGVAAAFAVSALVTEPAYAWLTGRLVGVGLGQIARDLAGVAQATAAMAFAVLSVQMLLVDHGYDSAVRLVLEASVGAVVFTIVCFWRAPAVIDEVKRLRTRAPADPTSS
jgi:O-antigen/teichoic acid export membrane protein